ncbi:FAD-dependent oxidoreductase [Pseudomonas sp. JL3]|uniref:FAD-dependent oxidoreductase n=1 Tax=Pseudomonas sp. JL3 TaxID=2919943 RepID=UPI0028705AEE|nr:FAD-dependent oxidoreductase [Pseudomonas sp. JL3]
MLRQWLSVLRPHGRIALISDGASAWYSGMLPGLLAGRYRPEQCRVPLSPLCASAGVELIQGEIVGIDPNSNSLRFADGRVCSATWLSLNVGSKPQPLPGDFRELELVPVKPFEGLVCAWRTWQKLPMPLAILGGGAAGVELALALAPQVPELTLISSGEILAGHPPGLRARAIRCLASANVKLIEGSTVDTVYGDALLCGSQIVWRGKRLILATGATPLPWLKEGTLAQDGRGFVAITPTFQSVSHQHILAVGDCASLPDCPRNGVYAVRQGPILARNLAAALEGRQLSKFVPQPHALALLADGKGGALMSWAAISAEGRFFGWWKDRLDQSFIHKLTIR